MRYWVNDPICCGVVGFAGKQMQGCLVRRLVLARLRTFSSGFAIHGHTVRLCTGWKRKTGYVLTDARSEHAYRHTPTVLSYYILGDSLCECVGIWPFVQQSVEKEKERLLGICLYYFLLYLINFIFSGISFGNLSINFCKSSLNMFYKKFLAFLQ